MARPLQTPKLDTEDERSGTEKRIGKEVAS